MLIPSRWSNLAFIFKNLQRPEKYHFCFRISIKTKALSCVQLDPAHQALINSILQLHKDGLNSRQIADNLNERGVTSWGVKWFYPELLFGVIRKARLNIERIGDAVVYVRCELVAR